jgi:hypothetical protein
MWLYPATGQGIFFYSGKAAAEWNKVSWLLKYGQGTLGSSELQIMDKLAEHICPKYRTLSSCVNCGSNPGDLSRCCCEFWILCVIGVVAMNFTNSPNFGAYTPFEPVYFLYRSWFWIELGFDLIFFLFLHLYMFQYFSLLFFSFRLSFW